MSEELHQCPCCPATKCIMYGPCLGCETYAEWTLNTRTQPEYKYATFECFSGSLDCPAGQLRLDLIFNAAREWTE